VTGPETGNWQAVGEAVRARRRELKMSTAELARLTGLSETTIRYLGATTRSKASLVAISAVLRWRYDHLTNILRGQPEKNVHVRPPPPRHAPSPRREPPRPRRRGTRRHPRSGPG